MNTTEKLEAFSVHDYGKEIYHSFGKVLRVVGVPDGELLVENQGEWSGPIITALRQIVQRLPDVKSIRIIRADTIFEANDLVRRGQVTLNITPQVITPTLVAEFDALVLSSQPFTNVLIFRARGCLGDTLGRILEQLDSDSPDAYITTLIGFFTDPASPEGRVIVNTEEQYNILVRADVDEDDIILNTRPITSYTELSDLMDSIAATTGISICNIAFFGRLSATNAECFPVTDLQPMGLIEAFLTAPADASFIGWIGPKYAPKLWLSLQAALDAWICECGVVSIDPVPIIDDINMRDCKSKCVPYVESCLLSAPPRLFSLCRRLIPDYAIHEFLARELCVNVHSVSGPFGSTRVQQVQPLPVPPLPSEARCVTASDSDDFVAGDHLFGLGTTALTPIDLVSRFNRTAFLFPFDCDLPATFCATIILSNDDSIVDVTVNFNLLYSVLNPLTGLYGLINSGGLLPVTVPAGETAARDCITSIVTLKRGDLVAILAVRGTDTGSNTTYRGTATICCE